LDTGMILECLTFGVPVGILYAYLNHTNFTDHGANCFRPWMHCRFSYYVVAGVTAVIYFVNVLMNGGF